MSLSTLNPPLPALEDLLALPRPPEPARLTRDQRRDILTLRSLNEEGEQEFTYERIAGILPRDCVASDEGLDHEALPSSKYRRLRSAAQEAWEAVGAAALRELVNTMHDRCQAVIDANGMHTKY